MPKKIILFTLQTFSTTGGIQKMTRTLAHSLFKISQQKKWSFRLWSLYDANDDLMEQYLPANKFTGFNELRLKLGFGTLIKATRSNIIILSHINLSLIGLTIKLVNPQCQVWLIAHGIEVWRPLTFIKRTFLKKYCDKVICVSNFTKQRMIDLHKINSENCIVLNNVVDPFILLPKQFTKPEYLLNRYGIDEKAPVIFTLTRLASTEQYKGYEQVIKVVGRLKKSIPHIKYILAGQYDEKEETRIKALLNSYDVTEQVILTGFIKEEELTDHFLLADLFVLPSKKEGFGIVFIEALACGLPVICGNEDGSLDAIKNGELGTAINVDDLDSLENAITDHLLHPIMEAGRQKLQNDCLGYFNEAQYAESLLNLFE